MKIRTIQKWFEEFECKFVKGIRSIRMEIQTIWKGLEAFEWKFEPLEKDSKHSTANLNISKRIWSIHLEILTIWKGLEAF